VAKKNRIRTSLYNDQVLLSGELDLLHTPALQRLYDLHQLGLTDRVYIDASHARLHHVVGVLEHVDKLLSAIVRNLGNTPESTFYLGQDGARSVSYEQMADNVEDSRPVVRLIGLLHDLTHAPYGHTVEDEIQLVGCKHDEPERQAAAFYRLLCQYVGWSARDLGMETSAEMHTASRQQLEAFDSEPGSVNGRSAPAGVQETQIHAGPVAPVIPETVGALLEDPERLDLPTIDDTVGLIRALLATSDDHFQKSSRLSKSEFAELLAQLRGAMTALLHLEVLHGNELESKHFPSTSYPFSEVIEQALAGTEYAHHIAEYAFDPHRDAYMLDVVGNTVCADLLDYAKRDARNANIKLDYDADRIAENFTLVHWDAASYHYDEKPRKVPDNCEDPFAGWTLRTAISLFSHKLRTDVPSELMNLLNVRFYLYERAIFHPTKCAAGAMLGTALQLLGLRDESLFDRQQQAPVAPTTAGQVNVNPVGASRETGILPERLRYIGDAVFIHDLYEAGVFARLVLEKQQAAGLSHVGSFEDSAKCQHCQNAVNDVSCTGLSESELRRNCEIQLAAEILSRHQFCEIATALREIGAGLRLIQRLRARRYLRPIFRALPNVQHKAYHIDAECMADKFRNPVIRYVAEREIERRGNLPPGSVVIHCPKSSTAEKIANVLLTLPDFDGSPTMPVRLRHIHQLDPLIFGAHENAIQAVEKMYHSMWRLLVFVAVEHMPDYPEISEIAGRVIFEHVAPAPVLKTHPKGTVKNDPLFELELKLKFGDLAPRKPKVLMVHPRERRIRVEVGEVDLGRALAKLVREDGVLPEIGTLLDGAGGELPPQPLDVFVQTLRNALSRLSNTAPVGATQSIPESAARQAPARPVRQKARQDQVLDLLKPRLPKENWREAGECVRDLSERLNRLSPISFGALRAELETYAPEPTIQRADISGALAELVAKFESPQQPMLPET
jgi:HD superfamily phosphohydrolase